MHRLAAVLSFVGLLGLGVGFCAGQGLECPDVCPDHVAPVCAQIFDQQQTYGNECQYRYYICESGEREFGLHRFFMCWFAS